MKMYYVESTSSTAWKSSILHHFAAYTKCMAFLEYFIGFMFWINQKKRGKNAESIFILHKITHAIIEANINFRQNSMKLFQLTQRNEKDLAFHSGVAATGCAYFHSHKASTSFCTWYYDVMCILCDHLQARISNYICFPSFLIILNLP